MMNPVRHKVWENDYLWGYLAQIMNAGSAIFLLPFVLFYLSSAEVGLWFVFVSLGILMQTAENSVNPVISRNISYILAGASRLKHSDLPELDNRVGSDLKMEFLSSVRTLYTKISLTLVLVSITVIPIYLYTLDYDVFGSLLPWAIYSLGLCVNGFYSYIGAVLEGAGKFADSRKIIVYTRIVYVIVGIITLTFGFGLIGLALSMLLSVLISRMVGNYLLSRNGFFVDNKPCFRWKNKHISSVIIFSAKKMFAIQLGTFFIQRLGVLISAAYLGLEDSAAYSITLTIFLTLYSLSIVPFQVVNPKINKMQAQGDRRELIGIVSSSIFYCLAIFFCSSIVIILIAPLILELMNSNVRLIDSSLVVFLAFIYLLELNHSLASGVIMSVNKTPFVNSALYSGIAILIISLFLSLLDLGVVAFLIAQFIVQLSYNNWKWPYMMSRIINVRYLDLLLIGGKRFFRNLVSFKQSLGLN